MRRNIAPILWVVILGAIPAAFYSWYFLGQRQRLAELNQRELGRAAENLRSVLKNAVVNVENLAKQQSFTRQLSYLELPVDGKEVNDKSPCRKAPAPSLDAGEGGLTIVAQRTCKEFDVRLEEILNDLVVGDGFEYLFVADEKGDILFQTRRGDRKRWIDQLRWVERQARDEAVNPTSPLRLRNIADLEGDPTAKTPFSRLIETTNSRRVKIAGDEYRMYLQPLGSFVEIAAGSAKDRVLVLGGLVNARGSVAAALAIEPMYAVGLAVLAGLALLTWPLLKFFVLAPSERFRLVDFYLLLLSTSALVGFCTVGLLELDNYWRFVSREEDRLERLAGNLAGGLKGELSGMVAQLSRYDKALHDNLPVNCTGFAQGIELFNPPRDAPLRIPPPSLYHSFVSVFWVNGGGMQFAKLTTASANTPRVNVAGRPYFREARDGHLWEFAGDPPAHSGPGFFVQAYRSLTTGDFETGLSMVSGVPCQPSPKPLDAAAVPANVAVLTTPLLSLGPRALPADYGFMLIDRSGGVLYHSDPRRALREDLFEEVSDPARLRAIVIAGRQALMTTNYRSVPHELYIRPLHELAMKPPDLFGTSAGPVQPNGWLIVTLRDLGLSRTVNSEAAIAALVWFTVYLVFFQLIPALIYVVVRGPKHTAWIWPSRAREPLYRGLTISLAVFAGAAIVLLVIARGWILPAVSSLMGAGAIALGIWEYRRWNRRTEHSGEPETGPTDVSAAGPWRFAAAALLLILTSFFPAVGFFKFAWNQELGALAAYEAKHMAQTHQDLELRIEDHARKRFADVYKGWDKVVAGTIAEQRAFVEKDLFDQIGPPAMQVTDTPKREANPTGSADPLANWKPVYNDASASLRYEQSNTGLAAQRNLSMAAGPLALIGGVLLLSALLGWVRYFASHLLWSDFAEREPAATDVKNEIQAARKDGRNLILVANSRAQEDSIRELMSSPPVRAASAAAAASSSQAAAPVPEGDGIFSLTEFLLDPDARGMGLLHLEHLAATGGAVVFSRVDPVAFLFGRGRLTAPPAGAGSRANSEWESRRWSDVLESFSIVEVPLPRGEPSDRDATIAPQRARDETLYWSLWNSCTDNEKLVLVQVAEEGLANPRQTQTVESLLRRGLLVIDPDLRPFHPDFRQFVHDACDRKALAEWERPSGIGWNQARWILVVLLVTVAVFLISTQRQALTPVVTFISGLTGAFAGILKLVSDVTPKQRVSE